MTSLRVLLCFLLSLHTTSHALLLVHPEEIFTAALLLLAAGGLGLYFFGTAETDRERSYSKIVVILWMLHGFIGLVTWLCALGGQRRGLEEGIETLVYFQCGFLLFASWRPGYQGIHRNAVLLLFLAILAGGPVAITAVVGYVALMISILALDNLLRYGAPLRLFWRATLPIGVPVVLLLLVSLVVVSPVAYEPPEGPSLAPSFDVNLLRAYLELLAYGIIATVIFVWLWRQRSRAAGSENEPSENIAAQFSEEIEPSPSRLPSESLGRWRDEVVRVYLRFLRDIEGRGIRRRPDRTPGELARRLPRSARTLTTIFSWARYGPRELTRTDFVAAEQAAAQALRDLANPTGGPSP